MKRAPYILYMNLYLCYNYSIRSTIGDWFLFLTKNNTSISLILFLLSYFILFFFYLIFYLSPLLFPFSYFMLSTQFNKYHFLKEWTIKKTPTYEYSNAGGTYVTKNTTDPSMYGYHIISFGVPFHCFQFFMPFWPFDTCSGTGLCRLLCSTNQKVTPNLAVSLAQRPKTWYQEIPQPTSTG